MPCGRFDRFNGTVWQVDIFLEGTKLWIHPKVTNPNAAPVPGYWHARSRARARAKAPLTPPAVYALWRP